ncbi:MAG: ornithine cyclodeaminase family protein [Melioribacteraceae bacterium]|nr:ornithine cyclodeaminase family protein [Melioribacteraceae bacterium]
MDKTTSERQPIRLIRQSEISKFFSMSEAIDSMEFAFARLSSGDCFIPKRYIARIQDESLTLLLKPAFVNNYDQSSIKILTQRNSNSDSNIPTILGIVLLIENKTGEILSIMDGAFITSLRTGAASGLATKYLSRKDSTNLVIFGCGAQGRTQLKAVTEVREIEKIWIFDKSPEKGKMFIEEMESETTAEIEFTNDLDVLKEADIICTATNSENPLFYKSHLKTGTHINAIGSFQPNMQEIDPEIIKSSKIYLDDREECLNESGDFLKAFKDISVINENLMGEIGEYLLQRIDGRESSDETTLFKSVGNAIQDFAVANRIYNKSLKEEFGQEIRLYE